MLFKAEVLAGVASGEVTVAFRSWKRPTVKAGGTLLTAAGQLRIDAVDPIEPAAVTDADARRAGFADAAAVRAQLAVGDRRHDPSRTTYRVAFHLLGDDPRIALRADDELTEEARADLDRRLAAMDRRSPDGPWTTAVLHAIATRPAEAARVLAAELGHERDDLKVRIRRLKALGLTESLGTGYRLSRRGRAYLGPDDPTAPAGWQRGHQ